MPKRVMDEKPAAAVVTAISPAPPAAPDKSVAVLPFVDMSEKKDQEYLGDGYARPALMELEIIDPSLFFRAQPSATDWLPAEVQAALE